MANVTHTIYRGPSLFDGSPIVVWAQSNSGNIKTGDMVQTFIQADGLHADNAGKDCDPLTMSRDGSDASYCGSCIHRGTPNNNAKGQATDRTCYVTLAHAPLGKHKAYIKGKYPEAFGHDAIAAIGKGRMVRLGTFGDPAAVPNYIWESLLSESVGHTAYTHGSVNPMPESIMTSADSPVQAREAWERGERTFRVISSLDSVIKGKEILCPASEEAGRKVTCISCKLCAGAKVKGKSIAIVAHGTSKRKFKESV